MLYTKIYWTHKTQAICTCTQRRLGWLQVSQHLSIFNTFCFVFSVLIPYRKVYANLITKLKDEPTTTPGSGPGELNREDYLQVTLWDKHDHGNTLKEHEEFASDFSGNVMFWFLQYEDGTTVSSCDISSMCSTSKEIWMTQLDKYKTMVSNGTAVILAQQKEFYNQIEAEYPFLQLCKDHYKAHKIRVFDYRWWYQKHKADKKAEYKGRKWKTKPSQEDTMEDTWDTHKCLRCTPSMSMRHTPSASMRCTPSTSLRCTPLHPSHTECHAG